MPTKKNETSVETKVKNINKDTESIQSITRNAWKRHGESNLHIKSPGYKQATIEDPRLERSQPVSSKVRNIDKTVSTKGKDVVKIKTAKSPTIVDPKLINNRYRGASGFKKLSKVGSDAIVTTMLDESFERGIYKKPNIDTKIAGKKARGYDTIQESMTDFDGRVILSKTTSKVNVTPTNSTRHKKVRTVKSVTDSNLSLKMHKNAINHTRY